MSFAAQGWAWAQTLPAPQKMVLLGLADCHNGETGQCNPSMKYLAEKCGVSRSSVIRHLAALEVMALITSVHHYREDGSLASNGYDLHIDEGLLLRARLARIDAKVERRSVTQPPGGSVTDGLRSPGLTHHEPGIEPGTSPGEDFETAVSQPSPAPKGAKATFRGNRKVQKPFSDDDRERLVAKYAEKLVEPSWHIEQSLNHTASLKALDLVKYVDGWLRREVERPQGKGRRTGDSAPAPPPSHKTANDRGDDRYPQYAIENVLARQKRMEALREEERVKHDG